MSDDATDLGNAGFGLMFYNARWYDSTTGRFAQADTVVPGGVQGFDRYAYVNNSPVNLVDPSGHSGCYRCQIHQEKMREITPPPEGDLTYVREVLCGGDLDLYNAWLILYGTEAGHEIAAYIAASHIKMTFWATTGVSLAGCSIHLGGCVIRINPALQPSPIETDPELLNKLVAELGHEGYHMKYGRPWHPAPGSNYPTTNSQFEEFGAFQAGNNIYYELTGKPHPGYSIEGYNKFDRSSLQAFFVDNKRELGIGYLRLPLYPPYYPYYLP